MKIYSKLRGHGVNFWDLTRIGVFLNSKTPHAESIGPWTQAHRELCCDGVKYHGDGWSRHVPKVVYDVITLSTLSLSST
jgi:hypothetical protein